MAGITAGCTSTESSTSTTPTTQKNPTATTTSATTTTESSGGGAGETLRERVLVGPGGELVFQPEELRIQPGTTVEFVWKTDTHNVVVEEQPEDAGWEGTAGSEDQTYDAGHQYSHTFETVGTYNYHCIAHQAVGMTGTIIVDPDPETEAIREPYTSETSIDAVTTDWPRFGATARNESTLSTPAPASFVPAWRHALGDGVETTQAPPVIADGTLYTWTAKRVLALDAATGTKQWEVVNEKPGWSKNAGPAVVDGVLYAGQPDGMTAFDASTGEKRWWTPFGEFVTSAPMITDERVVFTTVGEMGAIRALDRETGEPDWRFEFGGNALCAPASDGTSVYVGSYDDTFYALDAATGDVEWEFTIKGGCTSVPAVSDGRVYVIGWDENAYGLHAASGEQEWMYDVGRDSADSLLHPINRCGWQHAWSVVFQHVSETVTMR